jgi:cation:H+ antiporter
MLTYILFVVGFIILIKGAEMLVDGSVALARNFGISDIVIGLTIVSFGTSAPELVVNLIASFNGNSEIAVGNVLGSNIVNVFFILGISAVIYPLTVKENTTYKEIPFALLSAVVVLLLGNDIMFGGRGDSALSLGDGLVLLSFFTIFMYYIFSISKDGAEEATSESGMKLPKAFLLISLGLLGLIFGGKWIVDGAVIMAQSFGVSQSLIGLTIVAIGTSLPELATSAVAAYKRNTDIAIGNVVGSNIFNMFWILGISATINPIPVLSRSDVDFGVNILASLLLFVFLFIGKKHILQRWQGGAFIVCYIVYVAYLINQG